MFRKIRTTVAANGTVSQSEIYTVDALQVEADKADDRRKLRHDAMGYGRIAEVADTVTGLVITYTSGAVVIYQWIAEQP
jgi:hypothetical protein